MTEYQTTTVAAPTSRRALLIGAGGVGATVALAACGTGDDDTLGNGATNAPAGGDSTNGTETGGTETGGTDTGSGGAGLSTSEVPVGGGVILADQGAVVTQPAEGEFKAFSNICTHQGCPVANLDGGTINCTCHFSSFSIEDGSVVSGPAPSPLEEKTVTVDGDSLTVA